MLEYAGICYGIVASLTRISGSLQFTNTQLYSIRFLLEVNVHSCGHHAFQECNNRFSSFCKHVQYNIALTYNNNNIERNDWTSVHKRSWTMLMFGNMHIYMTRLTPTTVMG